MPTPQFIVELRKHIGHEPLWLIGVTAVVIDPDGDGDVIGEDGERGRVLLVRRSDNGQWTPVTGIVDPGEHPRRAAEREVLEEAGVHAIVTELAWVHVTTLTTHANGDQAQYLDHVFRLSHKSGEPYAADEESTAAQWFPLDALPPMSEHMLARIRAALTPGLSLAD